VERKAGGIYAIKKIGHDQAKNAEDVEKSFLSSVHILTEFYRMQV